MARKNFTAGELKLLQGSTEIRIILNSDGYIESMSKSRDELLEYSAKYRSIKTSKIFIFQGKSKLKITLETIDG